MDALYRSRHFPGESNRASLLSAALVQPLGVCMLPVMIGALTAMLTGSHPLPWLYAGFPAALMVASAWTALQLHRRVVEICIRNEGVLVTSAWELLASRREPQWRSLLDVRTSDGRIHLTAGHDTRTLIRSEWDEIGQIESKLKQAAHAFKGRVQDGVA